MDIHKPKPVHSWRELASEIGVIVIGVLIALTAEQIVESLHWAHELKAARAEMREELHASAYAAYERLAAGRCLTQRIADLHTRIVASPASWPGQGEGKTPGDPPLATRLS